MKIPRRKKKIIWEINVTPLTDVALVLLIIFMIAAPLIVQAGIKVKLPAAVSGEKENERKIVISLSADGKVYFKDDLVTREKLAELLVAYLSASQNRFVVIDADEKCSYGQAMEILDIARNSGAEKLFLSTRKKQTK